MKNKVYTILIIIFSIICGIITEDYYLGTILLACGILNCYYASLGKIYNYLFGALYCLLSGYICFKNGLYGLGTLSFIIYFPSQIHGYLIWKNKKIDNDEVRIRKFALKKSVIITTLCIIGSILFGLLLSQIPTQRLAFLDSSSNILNLCGIILMNLRYKECWIVYLFTNIFDLIIWLINYTNNTPNSAMMLLVSIGYLLINIYGLINWNKKANTINKI